MDRHGQRPRPNSFLREKVCRISLYTLPCPFYFLFAVIPVIGEVDNPKSWIGLISEIDVVIEAIGGNETYILSAAIHRAVSEAVSRRPTGTPKLSYIYTSGTWVHGEDRTTLVTDNTPITNPAKLVEWRPAVEQAIISDKTLNAIVIRPALVYGYTGSITGLAFGMAAQGKIVWPGTPGGRCAVVHADDLADLYVRAVGRAQLIGGLIFDASTSHSESVDDFLEKLVKVSGAQSPYEYKTPSNRE